jgi:hypothetical protein
MNRNREAPRAMGEAYVQERPSEEKVFKLVSDE